MMTGEDNKAIVIRAYLDGINPRNMNVLDEVFSPDYVSHFPGEPPTLGIGPLKAVLASFFEAFPDLVFSIEDSLAEGDKVVIRWTAKGTHLGPWRGFPPRGEGIAPTGKQVTLGATDIYLIGDGKILEEWNTLDQLAVTEQVKAGSGGGSGLTRPRAPQSILHRANVLGRPR
jgi:predicted ester cyclase